MNGKFAFGIENMNKPSESITKKLKDPNTTLEDLLKEEELLQEFKSQNKDLINYFNKEKIKEMLNYIIKEQEDEQEKGYKFPFLCSQIFGLEIDELMKYFFITYKQMEELEKNNKEEKKEDNKENKEDNKENDKDNINENKKEEENKEKNESEKKEEIPEEKKEEVKQEEKQEEKKKEVKTEEKKEDIKPEEKQEEKPEEKSEEKKEDEKQNEENNEENEENEEEKSEPESKENKIEVLDYLFKNFFPEDDSIKLNYVLCGYFSSLINNLLSMRPLEFLKYMYLERNEYLNKMVEHFYRKSISDTLSKIIHFENYFQNNEPLDEKTLEDMKDTRSYLLIDIFEKIDINMENEDLNSIYYFVTGLFDLANLNEEKPIFEAIINSKKIIKSIITKPFHDLDLINFSNDEEHEKLLNRRQNFSTIIDMILFFLKNIKKLKLEIPTNNSDSKSTINHTKISDEIFTVLKQLLQNNFIKKNENEKNQLQSFNDYQLKPLGEYKIKIIELLTHLVPYFKNISKFFDEILIEVDFCKVSLDLLLEYEWNNLYQEALLNLFKILLDHADSHQILHRHLIEHIKILDLIEAHTNMDNPDKFNFTSTKDNNLPNEERETTPIKRGYYSFFISLSYKLNTVMGGTPINIEGGIPRQGSFAFMKRVPEEGDKKAAMDLFYGSNLDEPEENDKEEKNEFSYKCMEEFNNDQWREFFGINIESVIKQFEDKNWPKQEKKPFDMALDDNNDKDVNLLNNDESNNDKNLFGNNSDLLGNLDDDKEDKNDRRAGVFEQPNDDENNNDRNKPFYNAIKEDNFDFGNEQENKNNNIDKNNFANENEFDFGDDNKDNKDIKNEENKDNKDIEKKDEDNKNKEEEIKPEEKKENKEEKNEINERKEEEEKEKANIEKTDNIKEQKENKEKSDNIEEKKENIEKSDNIEENKA